MGNAEQEADARRGLLNKMGRDWNAFNNQVVGFPIPQQPELLSEDRATFREGFMQEELDEFRKANRAGDLDGSVDACIDLLYVTVGALGEMGVLVQPTWDEVQRANMAKVRGGLSKRPGSKGFDAVKPEGWKAPSHADYLTITSADVATVLALRAGRIKTVPADVASVVNALTPTPGHHWEENAFGWYLASNGPEVPGNRTKPEPVITPVRQPGLGFKVILMGYARHGKDTVAEMLRDRYGLRFVSSSQFCAERVVLPAVRKMWERFNGASPTRVEQPAVGPYASPLECFDDRANHRKFWFDTITAYNTPDLSRLGREIFQDFDVYCGIRNHREFHALKNAGVFDVAIWVDASGRGLPAEGKDSCTVEPWMADFVLDNSGSLEDLSRNLEALVAPLMEG